MDVSQFAADLRGRIEAAQRAYDEAERDGDFYAMDVRSGELTSLRRLAAENGVVVPPPAEKSERSERSEQEGQA
jgi:hypothetical protein